MALPSAPQISTNMGQIEREPAPTTLTDGWMDGWMDECMDG
jgi:hypothetical protein